MTDGEDTRKKILQGTLDILGKKDAQNITVRMIARETGVNIALIKYYFGSKENLATFGDHIATMLGDLEAPGALPDERLRHMVFQMMYCIVYPVMLGKGVKTFLGTELKTEKEWQKYISCLLDAYVPHRKGEK